MTRRKTLKKIKADLPQATETPPATQPTGVTQTDIIIPKGISANAVLVTAYYTEKSTAYQFYVPPQLSIAQLRDVVHRELGAHVAKEWGLSEDVLHPNKEVILFSSDEKGRNRFKDDKERIKNVCDSLDRIYAVVPSGDLNTYPMPTNVIAVSPDTLRMPMRDKLRVVEDRAQPLQRSTDDSELIQQLKRDFRRQLTDMQTKQDKEMKDMKRLLEQVRKLVMDEG
ncbi:hypothetical protein FIBSPDRAFT_926458 [Athelia psychrophila]|uniref:Uncharacterized protein n=1 Tax=Athelia psychrophila TaxID=1759441 RepID=A0A166T6K8_9AGAM|nr:hypothetical protein FIBSPDRAFT_926458 [Fibularhizoctonia sp. CBS 109695]